MFRGRYCPPPPSLPSFPPLLPRVFSSLQARKTRSSPLIPSSLNMHSGYKRKRETADCKERKRTGGMEGRNTGEGLQSKESQNEDDKNLKIVR